MGFCYWGIRIGPLASDLTSHGAAERVSCSKSTSVEKFLWSLRAEFQIPLWPQLPWPPRPVEWPRWENRAHSTLVVEPGSGGPWQSGTHLTPSLLCWCQSWIPDSWAGTVWYREANWMEWCWEPTTALPRASGLTLEQGSALCIHPSLPNPWGGYVHRTWDRDSVRAIKCYQILLSLQCWSYIGHFWNWTWNGIL